MPEPLDLTAIEALPAEPLGKVLGPGFDGVARRDLAASRPGVSALVTPFLTIDASAVDENIASLQQWCDERGYLLAPHGKTTMAPQLWSRQLTAGAWGISVATTAQMQVALAAGVRRVLLANPFGTRAAVERARTALAQDPEREIISWVDSVAAVEALASPAGPELPVLLDVGRPGGRTGVRDRDEAVHVVEAVLTTPGVRLAGTAAYEGAIGGGPSRGDIVAFTADVLRLHRELVLEHTGTEAYLSIGGSDRLAEVAEGLADLRSSDGRAMLRCGVTITHDDGLYRDHQAQAPASAPRFRAALRLVATVLAVHDEGVALLDVGRRDAGYDNGLPTPLVLWRDGAVIATADSADAVPKMNDQHTFVAAGTFAVRPQVGDRVTLGISHACTTFDKWRDIVEVPGPLTPDSPAIGLIRTYF